MTGHLVRVALVNDYEIVLAGVRKMLEPHSERIEVVEIDANKPVSAPVHIALYDTYGQDSSSLAGVRQALGKHMVEHVVLYSWNFDQRLVSEADAAGISGVLAKSLSSEQLVAALLAIAEGRRIVSGRPTKSRDVRPAERGANDWPGREAGLTMREAEMIAMIAQGLSNNEIAERTYLSLNSVKSYIRGAYGKIGVHRRAQAVAWGIEHGLVPDRSRERT